MPAAVDTTLASSTVLPVCLSLTGMKNARNGREEGRASPIHCLIEWFRLEHNNKGYEIFVGFVSDTSVNVTVTGG